MLDKMARVENVVAELTIVLGIHERMIPVIKDAAGLAMSDLATSIVTEFTSLAGIMARHYALRDGLPEQVDYIFCQLLVGKVKRFLDFGSVNFHIKDCRSTI